MKATKAYWYLPKPHSMLKVVVKPVGTGEIQTETGLFEVLDTKNRAKLSSIMAWSKWAKSKRVKPVTHVCKPSACYERQTIQPLTYYTQHCVSISAQV